MRNSESGTHDVIGRSVASHVQSASQWYVVTRTVRSRAGHCMGGHSGDTVTRDARVCGCERPVPLCAGRWWCATLLPHASQTLGSARQPSGASARDRAWPGPEGPG